MDLRQVKTFLRVAELGSLSAAAAHLHTAQPAISRQIQLLEEDLEVRLFWRHGRGVKLTPEGELFKQRASSILREVELAKFELKAAEEGPRGQVVLGVPPTIGDVLSGPLCERITEKYPRLRMRIVAAYSGHIQDWMNRGILDIAVTYASRDLKKLAVRPLLTERLYAVAAPSLLSASAKSLPFNKLLQMKVILPSEQHGLRKLLDGISEQFGTQLDPIVESDGLQIQIDLARRGLGGTVLPLVSVYEQVKSGELVALPLTDPQVSRTVVIAVANSRASHSATQKVREMIVATAKELAQSGRWDAKLEA